MQAEEVSRTWQELDDPDRNGASSVEHDRALATACLPHGEL